MHKYTNYISGMRITCIIYKKWGKVTALFYDCDFFYDRRKIRRSPDDTMTQLYEKESDQRESARQHPAKSSLLLSGRDCVSRLRLARWRTSSRGLLASPRHPRNRLAAVVAGLQLQTKGKNTLSTLSTTPALTSCARSPLRLLPLYTQTRTLELFRTRDKHKYSSRIYNKFQPA